MIKLTEAVTFAVDRHKHQVRQVSKIPYAHHVLEVAKMTQQVYDSLPDYVKDLLEVNRDEMIIASYFHDLIEDTITPKEEIVTMTNEKVANLVLEMSRDADKEHRQGKYDFLKTFENKSLASIIIKIADRLANVRDYMDAGKRKYASKYALQAYPLYNAFYKFVNIEGLNYDLGVIGQYIYRLDEIVNYYYPLDMKKSSDIMIEIVERNVT